MVSERNLSDALHILPNLPPKPAAPASCRTVGVTYATVWRLPPADLVRKPCRNSWVSTHMLIVAASCAALQHSTVSSAACSCDATSGGLSGAACRQQQQQCNRQGHVSMQPVDILPHLIMLVYLANSSCASDAMHGICLRECQQCDQLLPCTYGLW